MPENAWVNGTKMRVYGGKGGGYSGSKQNGGRKIYSAYNPKTGKKTSVNAASVTWQKSTGKKPKPGTHIDHKDNNHKNGSAKNLTQMPASKNIGKGNRNRKR